MSDDGDDNHEMARLWGWGSDDDDDVIGWHDLHPCRGFYHGGTHVEPGRVFRDPDRPQGCHVAIKGVSTPDRTATLVEVTETDDGELETEHGTFTVTSDPFDVDWIEEGGRYIPR